MKSCIIETDVGQLVLAIYYNKDKNKFRCILYGTTSIDGHIGMYEERRSFLINPIKEKIINAAEKLITYHYNWKNKKDFVYWLSNIFNIHEKEYFMNF